MLQSIILQLDVVMQLQRNMQPGHAILFVSVHQPPLSTMDPRKEKKGAKKHFWHASGQVNTLIGCYVLPKAVLVQN